MNIYVILTVIMFGAMFFSAGTGLTTDNVKVAKISYAATVIIPVIAAMVGAIVTYGMTGVLMTFIGLVTMIISFMLFYKAITAIKRTSR